MQSSEPFSEEFTSKLNERLFQYRPDIEFRVFGFYSTVCDLSFVKRLANVESFSADCLMEVKNIATIAEMPNLKALSIGVFKLENLDILEKVTENLIKLSIAQTFSKKPSLSSLSRFTNLKTLYIEGHSKGIENIALLSKLEDLTLRSVTIDNLDFLSALDSVWSVDIKLGGIKNLSALAHLKNLKYLEIWQVRDFTDISFISYLSTVQNLFLQSLPRLTEFPSLIKCDKLRRICLQNLKGMKDFSSFEFAPNLQEFALVEGLKQEPIRLSPVLKNRSLKSAAGYFGSVKKNKEFIIMLNEYGKSEYKWTEFQYN